MDNASTEDEPVSLGPIRYAQFIFFQLYTTIIVMIALRRLSFATPLLFLILATAVLTLVVTASDFHPTIWNAVFLPLLLGALPGILKFFVVSMTFDHFKQEADANTPGARSLTAVSVGLGVLLFGLHIMMIAVPNSKVLLVTIIHTVVAIIVFAVAHFITKRSISSSVQNIWIIIGSVYVVGFFGSTLTLTLSKSILITALVAAILYCLSIAIIFAVVCLTSKDVSAAATAMFSSLTQPGSNNETGLSDHIGVPINTGPATLPSITANPPNGNDNGSGLLAFFETYNKS